MLWVLIRSASNGHHNIFAEALLMGTHNICFYGELQKMIRELSPNTTPYKESESHCYFDNAEVKILYVS